MIVAVDGPAAAGKGTIARRLADRFGLAYLDTGALYRAVAFSLLRAGADPADPETAVQAARNLHLPDTVDPRVRAPEVGLAASVVAAIPQVRAALLDLQRDFARQPPDRRPGAVLDGRDIGTVVCPDADRKIFVTATPEVRARRRHLELLGRGERSIYATVLADLRERDARDANRVDAPLRQSRDAMVLDTSLMTAHEAFRRACAFVESAQ